MSYDVNNPYQSSVPPPKRGMSSLAIILISLGVLGVVSVAVCCGGAFYLGSQVASVSPDQVETVADSIVDVDIPDPWRPFMSFDLTRFGGPMRMAMYVVDLEDESNMAMMMDMDVPERQLDNPEAFQEQMVEQMDQQMRQRKQSMESLQILKSDKLEFSVNGQPAHAQVSDAEGEESGQPYHEVIVVFHGKEHPGVLYMRALNDDFSREDIDQMLDSMKD